jgi:hypothetical protein
MGEWGDKVDVNPMPESTLSPQSGTMNLATALSFLYHVREANHLLYQIFVNFNTELDFFSVSHFILHELTEG